MRKPNGYGAVIKLSGARRKPYALRITQGWTATGKQIYKYVGYYTNRKDAEIALAEFNKNPYVINETITFSELYERYAESATIATATQKAYRTAFNNCSELFDLPITKLNLGVLQRFVDLSDKKKTSLMTIKALWAKMFEYAIRNEWLPPERKSVISMVDLSKKEVPQGKGHSIFTHKEIETLWNNVDNITVRQMLILIYTGVRISELLNLSEDDIHGNYFDVVESKTKAGIRQVPIADKILPFFGDRPQDISYAKFLHEKWGPVCEGFGMDHKPHDTRHTCITLLTEKEVDPRIIKAIVGHAGSGITEAVYTHVPISKLLVAINKI